MIMHVGFDREDVRSWCGERIYYRGLDYYQNGRVYKLLYDPRQNRFDAVVVGAEAYKSHVAFDEDGCLNTGCNCPAHNGDHDICKHVAAMLLEICEGDSIEIIHRSDDGEDFTTYSDPHWHMTNEILSLFEIDDALSASSVQSAANEPASSEIKELQVEFQVSLHTPMYDQAMITIEMKMGVNRLYVVQKMKDLFDQIMADKPYTFTKLFTYRPDLHRFKEEDRAVIDHLLEIYQYEKTYRDFLGYYPPHYGRSNKSLLIPAAAWDHLWPKLQQTNVAVCCEGKIFSSIIVEENQLPFRFRVSSTPSDKYLLQTEGLDTASVLQDYGYLFKEGVFYKADPWQLEKIEELKRHLTFSPTNEFLIDQRQMNTFVHRVIPSLQRIGQIEYAPEVSEQIQSPPLRPKIYLDRDGDRLTIRAEFVYGDEVFYPAIAGWDRRQAFIENRSSVGKYLLRDIQKEHRITQLLLEAPFSADDQMLVIEEEEDTYHFLYHVLPRLNEEAEVYLSSSVKPMMHELKQKPKTSLEMGASVNLLEVKFDLEGIDEKEVGKILQTIVEKKKYYRMANGAFLSLEQEEFRDMKQVIEQLGIRNSELGSGQLKVPAVRALQLEENTRKSTAVKVGKALRQFLEQIRRPDLSDFKVPKPLEGILRDYQVYGYQWFKTLHQYQFGGILADDMGLGKTLQSIAYVLSEKLEQGISGKPAFIIAPASLVYNWKNEIAKFAPMLRTVAATGTKQERAAVIAQADAYDVVITSYPLIRRDAALYEKLNFSILILDEAQAIKNSATQTAQAVKTIQAERKFALTGTPIENSLDELWSIFDAVFPGLFPGKQSFGRMSPEQVAKIAKPFILRRMKQDVLKELPDKIETVRTTELNKEQKKLYLAYLERIQQETLQQIEEEGFQKSRLKILAGLTRLRQLCCHPAMFIENYNGGSSKLEQLIELLQELRANGSRALIFSQFTSMLAIIRRELEREGMDYFYLDGQTPGEERVQLAERFNQGEKQFFLISLKAGGTGLNLTGADTVILYDLWWNPAVEQQAADRAHRLGQKNVVQVIRLITEGTIEEKMHELQQKKKDLIDQVVQPGEAALSSFSEEEIRELLMLRSS